MPLEEKKILDNEQVNNLKELFGAGFSEFLNTYFHDFEEKEKELLAEMKKNNFEMVTKIAHSIKGSSLNVGALELAGGCLEIEKAAKEKNEEKVKGEYTNLIEIYEKTKKELSKFTA
jgi:HPt (histidine-containing phosphotransfer) domain-containing protein